MSHQWNHVGRTKLVYIRTLSEITGCHIWGKAEFDNPGGSIKDRASKQIILEAERNRQLTSGATIVEGTAGNTGIGLSLLGVERGYKVIIFMPDNQAQEKVELLKKLGAEVFQVPPCPFSNPGHFYHRAREYAQQHSGVFWANQFENLANLRAHYEHTGPEIWGQTHGRIDVFIGSVGTGGTVGGVSRSLKEKHPGVQVVVADPYGSGVHEYLQNGQFKGEGSSITEGIGIMRLTENFKQAKVDRSLRISDQEMINMLYFLLKEEGLSVGTSAALNLMACLKVGLQNKGTFKTIVTVLCDRADRYRSKVLSMDWLKEKTLLPQPLDLRS